VDSLTKNLTFYKVELKMQCDYANITTKDIEFDLDSIKNFDINKCYNEIKAISKSGI
jgi:hypothetical protein